MDREGAPAIAAAAPQPHAVRAPGGRRGGNIIVSSASVLGNKSRLCKQSRVVKIGEDLFFNKMDQELFGRRSNFLFFAMALKRYFR
jgi:hypothetical protein